MKDVKKFYVLISFNGKTVCENHQGYRTRKEAKERAELWKKDGFEVGILKL